MRLWSLHPKYLDPSGLTACWREALLARAVLSSNTIGYRNHPQLYRFRASSYPLAAINIYLAAIYCESVVRGYRFDASKITSVCINITIDVTEGQLAYEFEHLKNKLRQRSPSSHEKISKISHIEVHPMFRIIDGEIQFWECVR